MNQARALGLCRTHYDALPERRGHRDKARLAQLSWVQMGLESDPLLGWRGAHGLAVRSTLGTCKLRRPNRAMPGAYEIRRPGHALARTGGWVHEPIMWLFDAWRQAQGYPHCYWCGRVLLWPGRARRRQRLLVHPARREGIDWTPAVTVAACATCAEQRR